MTYDEIKNRLTQVESALQSIHSTKSPALDKHFSTKTVEQLTTIKESLQKQLAEKEETMFISTKGGDTKAVAMDRKSAMDLKKDPNITGIDTAKGQKLKEVDRLDKNSGVEFDNNETKAIAKQVGKALAIALKKAGDELARMKAHRIEPNSFDIQVDYKGESGDDEFSFYIKDDSLHLVDFSFDKELVNVGVKPSGEAIVNVDVLANELLKHFKSLNEEEVNEVNYSTYTEPKHFDICPGATALRKKLLKDKRRPIDESRDDNQSWNRNVNRNSPESTTSRNNGTKNVNESGSTRICDSSTKKQQSNTELKDAIQRQKDFLNGFVKKE